MYIAGAGFFGAWGTAVWPWTCWLLWPAASLTVIGVGSLLGRSNVFGKRHHTGRVPLWSYLFHAWYYGVYTGIWWGSAQIWREPVANEIVPGLWLGRRPSGTAMPPEVDVVVDLTAAWPRPASTANAEYVCLPTIDGNAPDDSEFVALATEIAARKTGVLVYCAMGHARGATLVAAVLLRRDPDLSVDDAINLVKAARPRATLLEAQQDLLARVKQQFHDDPTTT